MDVGSATRIGNEAFKGGKALHTAVFSEDAWIGKEAFAGTALPKKPKATAADLAAKQVLYMRPEA